jgi:hypothetical protein
VERDENFAYSVSDYTPTERREDDGKGAPEPHTMALRIVKDRVREACEEGSDLRDRMTAKEVWERLVEEMNGQVRKSPSSKTVKRWLDRWVEDGVMVEGAKVKVEGVKAPVSTYTLPPSCARALRKRECLLSVVPRERLQEQEIKTDKPSSPEYGVHRSDEGRPVPDNDGHRSDQKQDVHRSFPVVPRDLGERGTKDTSKHTKEEPHGQRAPVQATPSSAPEVDQGDEEGRPLGAEVPGGEDCEGSALGDDSDLEVDDRRPSDHPDVAEQGSPVQRHDVDTPARRELRYYQGPEDDFSALFEE